MLHMIPHAVQQAKRSGGIRIRGIFRIIERYLHMRLSAQIIDLVGLRGFDNPAQAGGIGQIPIVQDQTPPLFMRVGIKMIDARRVEGRAAPDQAVNGVSLGQEKLAKIRTVLSGNACDKCRF